MLKRNLLLFSDEHYAKWNPELNDDPFYVDERFSLFGKNADENFYTGNWNEFSDEHQLSKEVLCFIQFIASCFIQLFGCGRYFAD